MKAPEAGEGGDLAAARQPPDTRTTIVPDGGHESPIGAEDDVAGTSQVGHGSAIADAPERRLAGGADRCDETAVRTDRRGLGTWQRCEKSTGTGVPDA